MLLYSGLFFKVFPHASFLDLVTHPSVHSKALIIQPNHYLPTASDYIFLAQAFCPSRLSGQWDRLPKVSLAESISFTAVFRNSPKWFVMPQQSTFSRCQRIVLFVKWAQIFHPQLNDYRELPMSKGWLRGGILGVWAICSLNFSLQDILRSHLPICHLDLMLECVRAYPFPGQVDPFRRAAQTAGS